MRASVITIKNTKKWESIKKRLMAKANSVEVGFINNATYEDGTTVAQVAQWNEEGYINKSGKYTPSRTFFRTALKHFMKDRFKHHSSKVRHVAEGRLSWDALHKALAIDLKEAVRQSIIDWKIPPNSSMTVALKGFNNPLIDSSRMLNSITYRLKGKADV